MKVKTVSIHERSILVEWIDEAGMPKRCYLPAETVNGNTEVDAELLQMGIPYGVPWGDIDLRGNSVQLQRNLRNAGIWTGEDARTRPQVVLGAILQTYQVDVARLMRFAQKDQRRQNGSNGKGDTQ